MRQEPGRGVFIRACAVVIVLAGTLALSVEAAEAAPSKGRPTPKPSRTVNPGHGHAGGTGSPSPTPASSPSTAKASPVPTAAPTPVRTARAVPVPVPQFPRVTTPRPTQVRPAASAHPTAAAQHQPRRDSEGLGNVAHSLAQAATTSPQLPLGLLVTVAIFLLVQNRIDRRDPKLSVTDATSSVELEFRPVRHLPPPQVRRRHIPLVISPASGAIAATDVALPRAAPRPGDTRA